MIVTIERRIQVHGMSPNEAESLKHVQSYTAPSYMALPQHKKSSYKKEGLFQLADRTFYKRAMLMPRAEHCIDRLVMMGATIHDCTVTYPTQITHRTPPTAEQAKPLADVIKHRQGVILAPNEERIILGVMLAVLLGQRSLIIVPRALDVKAWRDVIEQQTGTICGVLSGRRCTEGDSFTVADVKTLPD